MVSFNKILVGDTLWDCRRTKMGNTTMTRMSSWPVVVKEIDTVRERIFASWNGNSPTWYGSQKIQRLRRSPAKPE